MASFILPSNMILLDGIELSVMCMFFTFILIRPQTITVCAVYFMIYKNLQSLRSP